MKFRKTGLLGSRFKQSDVSGHFLEIREKEPASPIVSIVMPVYNAMPYLRDALSDIDDQTYKNFELICVDDGSTDESPEVLDFFARQDERIRIIRQENRGGSAARNSGIEMAGGEYLWIVDADDRFEPFCLDRAISRMEDTGSDVVCFDSGFYDSDSCMYLSSDWITNRDEIPDRKVFNFKDYPDSIFNIVTTAPWNKICRRSFINENEIRFEERPYMQDSLFSNLIMIKAKSISYIDEKLLYHRSRSGSVSRVENRKTDWHNPYDILDDQMKLLKQDGIYDIVWKSFAKYASIHMLWNEEILEEQDFYEMLTDVKSKYLERFKIDMLTRDDFKDKELYDKLWLLKNSTVEQYLYDLLKRVIAKKDYLYGIRGEQCVKKPEAADVYFRFPFVEDGSKVVICGDGSYADRIHYLAVLSDKYKVYERAIHNPGELKKTEYDYGYAVIAENSFSRMLEIKKKLSRVIDKDTVVWA